MFLMGVKHIGIALHDTDIYVKLTMTGTRILGDIK